MIRFMIITIILYDQDTVSVTLWCFSFEINFLGLKYPNENIFGWLSNTS